MSADEELPKNLAGFSDHDLEYELLRRRCGFEGHQPYTFVNDGLGSAVAAVCECGTAHYDIRRTR